MRRRRRVGFERTAFPQQQAHRVRVWYCASDGGLAETTLDRVVMDEAAKGPAGAYRYSRGWHELTRGAPMRGESGSRCDSGTGPPR
jgi:hypothetical protein